MVLQELGVRRKEMILVQIFFVVMAISAVLGAVLMPRMGNTCSGHAMQMAIAAAYGAYRDGFGGLFAAIIAVIVGLYIAGVIAAAMKKSTSAYEMPVRKPARHF